MEGVGASADRFDVAGEPNNHLAFGFGTHFCLGASLARLEIRTMFAEVLGRLRGLELASPPERLRSSFINGIKHLRSGSRAPPEALPDPGRASPAFG